MSAEYVADPSANAPDRLPGPRRTPLAGLDDSDGAGRFALVVDDEPDVGAMMAFALDSQGWHTVVATAPEDAAALAHHVDFDLLVTDFHMPGMSGLDLALRLRERRAGLPVLLMSGSAEAATLELAPPYAFLEKPFPLHGFFGTVRALFGETSPPTSVGALEG
jgi:CheY-like chemotaxis protein